MRWDFFVAALCLLVSLFFFSLANAETTWPQFRGPDGQGHSDATGLPLHWDESTNIVWKTPILGNGWSSPVVANEKIWLTSATEITASEAEREAADTSGKGLLVAKTITLWACEVDLSSGKLLRKIKLTEVESPQPIHSLNSYASPTPVLAKDRLYCHFGDYGTFCLDTVKGEIVWQKRIQLEHGVGPGSSPLLVDDLLVLTCDGMDTQYILALHAADGSKAWQTDRPAHRSDKPDFLKSFCTPLLIDVNGEEQLVIPGAQWCVAYAPYTGKEIWRVDHGQGFSIVPRPVFDGTHLFICTGYPASELVAIRADGRGDVTETHIDWKASKQIPARPSPLVHDDRIYTVNDGGIAQCFETATGDRLWKKRIGGKFSASPLYADGRLYLCSQEGRTTVIVPGDEYEKLATNDLDGQLMASPVVVDNDLLLRTDSHLYRIGE